VAELTTASAGARHAAHPVGSALLVLAGAALFGTVGTAQILGPDVPAAELAAARLLVTGVVFTAVAVALGHTAGIAASARQAPAWFAGVGQAGFNLCFLAAMREAGVAVGTLVAIGAAPVVTGLITRHVTRVWLVATAIAVAGLAMLVGGQQGTASAPSPLGVLLALGAATSYATYIVAGNAAEARGLETQSFLAAAFSVSAALTLPWLVLGETGWVATAGGATLLGYLVLFPTLLAYSLFNRGLRGVRSSTASTLGLIEPVVAATLAYTLLGERLGAVGVVGAVLILLGLVVMVRSSAADAAAGRRGLSVMGQSPGA
jgi:DME family drug/metabolite transporter